MDKLERLSKGCRRLAWPSPLLRCEGCAPLAAGSRAIIEHVDDSRPVHNLEGLAQLTATLPRIGPAARKASPPDRTSRRRAPQRRRGKRFGAMTVIGQHDSLYMRPNGDITPRYKCVKAHMECTYG